MRNLLDFDEDESILAVLRLAPDRELQRNIVMLLDLRNHADGWLAEQWNDVLCLAVRVRDERKMLVRATDDAVSPFRVGPDISSSSEPQV